MIRRDPIEEILDSAIEHTRGGNAVQPAMPNPLKAVAFDLDSTLSHYSLTVQEVVERAVARAGFPPAHFGPSAELAADYGTAWRAAEEDLRAPTSELRRRAWSRILETRGFHDQAAATQLASAYSEIRRETGFRLFDGVRPLLADLRRTYRLGILTNGPSDMQWKKLRTLELPSSVDAIVVAGDVGAFKPDPRPFRRLLEQLDTSPEAAVFVGDSFEHDIIGAHGVGMRTTWITDDNAGNRVPRVDHVINHVTDLREILL